MGVIGSLVDKFKAMRRRSRGAKEWKALALAAVADGALSDNEIQALEAKRDEFGLSDAELARFKTEIFFTAMTAAKADARITPEEDASLDRIAKHFAVEIGHVQRTQIELARFRLLYEIDRGNLPQAQPSGLVLKKAETPHWAEPAALVEEKVVRREYVGGSSGVSIRVAKGVTYRVGQTRGQLVSETGIVPVSRGKFVLTNQRVAFLGDRKSFSIPWNKILDFQLFSNGARVSKDGKGAPSMVAFDSVAHVDIIGAIASQLVSRIGEEPKAPRSMRRA